MGSSHHNSDHNNTETLTSKKRSTLKEKLIELFLASNSMLSIITTIGIVMVLLFDSWLFFSEVSIFDFFTGTQWAPHIEPVSFGVLPIISGTLVFTIVTALIAIPIGLLSAVFLSEYASNTIKAILKPALEILAGIPTVVYGYFALIYITPILKNIFPQIKTFNILSAAIVVAIMIIPTIASISEDAMRAVPGALREAGYALGAVKYQVSTQIVIPSALSGIIASFILGISRVIGETMAVTIAAGNYARMINPFDLESALLQPVQTMTAAMVETGISDVSGDSVSYKSLFAIGLTLFVITMILNLISIVIRQKFQEKYD